MKWYDLPTVTERQRWNLAWSKLNALQNNPPPTVDDEHVREYHEALQLLTDATGEDTSPFWIPDDQLKPQVLSFQRIGRRVRGGITRYHPTKKICNHNFFIRQLEALFLYFKTVAAPQSGTGPHAKFVY